MSQRFETMIASWRVYCDPGSEDESPICVLAPTALRGTVNTAPRGIAPRWGEDCTDSPVQAGLDVSGQECEAFKEQMNSLKV